MSKFSSLCFSWKVIERDANRAITTKYPKNVDGICPMLLDVPSALVMANCW
jgi:hypothetical protein